MNFRRQALRIVIACAVVVGSLFAFDFYEAYPVNSFCSEVPDSATAEAVMALAKNKGLRAFDVIGARGAVSVLNHDSPFFRHACEVEFKNGRQVHKRVITAD